MFFYSHGKTFYDYVNTNIAGFVRSHRSYESVTRLEIVFDTYPEEDLKAQTHQRKGTGSRTKVNGRTPIPKRNWNSDFLKKEEELFVYISEEITKHGMSGILLLSTKKYAVLSNRPEYSCILHVLGLMAIKRHLSFLRTVVSDVVILAIRF